MSASATLDLSAKSAEFEQPSNSSDQAGSAANQLAAPISTEEEARDVAAEPLTAAMATASSTSVEGHDARDPKKRKYNDYVEDEHEKEDVEAEGTGTVESEVASEKKASVESKVAEEDKRAETFNERQDRQERKRRDEVSQMADWRERRDRDQHELDQKPSRKREYTDEERKAFKEKRRAEAAANIKTDYTKQQESSDPKEIRKQVEFYFSDSNLPTDKFLLSQVGGAENNPVPIKTIHDFKRMRHFQPYSAVVEALRESELLEVTEDEGVKRKSPLSDDFSVEDLQRNEFHLKQRALARTVYVKGFGEEGPTTQFDIEAFFEPYGPVNAVRLRRDYRDKLFKGSVFVEFTDVDKANAFLALEPKAQFNGKELNIMSKEQYERRELEREQVRREEDHRDRSKREGEHREHGRGGHRGHRGKRPRHR